MRMNLMEEMKQEIEKTLRNFLREEGLELCMAANDNQAAGMSVRLETVEDVPLAGSALLTEIRLALGLLGPSRQCDALARGIYQALQPHDVSHSALAVILMSMHIETIHMKPRQAKKRLLLRYIVDASEARSAETHHAKPYARINDTECC